MCWTLGCWAWLPGGCGSWAVLIVYVKLISISLLVFCLSYGLPVLVSSVMKLWVYDVFSESESCNSVFVTVWYHFFFPICSLMLCCKTLSCVWTHLMLWLLWALIIISQTFFFYIIVFSGSGNLANVGSFHFKTILMFVNCLKHSWY